MPLYPCNPVSGLHLLPEQGLGKSGSRLSALWASGLTQPVRETSRRQDRRLSMVRKEARQLARPALGTCGQGCRERTPRIHDPHMLNLTAHGRQGMGGHRIPGAGAKNLPYELRQSTQGETLMMV